MGESGLPSVSELVSWWVDGLVGWWVGDRWGGGLVGWWVGALVGSWCRRVNA